ncbi:hypothetical protein BDN71DRAFT_901430 [Pleurotus eryngii]|uniref:Uncharacterized protein n=1 Tax=Pleurotus eryngii TaxID=5323 RepID=A0A9P5ZV82_PLEER|nr:hypothetical protein BDN71DRAFT_901430 [Pleurotus eryngii]
MPPSCNPSPLPHGNIHRGQHTSLSELSKPPRLHIVLCCSCHKIGGEWICAGSSCLSVPVTRLVARQCSCKKIGDEWFCTGRTCV